VGPRAETPLIISIRIVGGLSEIRTGLLPNTSEKRYRFVSCLITRRSTSAAV
jgi:hypothetical protein